MKSTTEFQMKKVLCLSDEVAPGVQEVGSNVLPFQSVSPLL